MRVLILDAQGSGVGYYRSMLPYGALQKHIDVDYVCFPDVNAKDIPQWLFEKLCAGYDLVHTGYITHVPFMEAFVAARAKCKMPIITDIDDDILHVPTYNRAFRAYHGGAQERKLARLWLRVSDAVSVSTPPLRDVLIDDCKDIEVLPNTIQPADWKDVGCVDDDDSIRLMFAGNIGRYGDLLEVQEAVEHVMNKYPQLRLFFITCIPDWANKWMKDKQNPRNNRAFAIRRCAVSTYQAVFKWINPHIVYAPVQKNEFNKSKSHIKAYDAAMCNAVFVCTDWDTYADVPNNAAVKIDNTDTQWKESLCALIEDAALRKRLHDRLHTWAVDEWHIDKHVEKWVNLYEKVHAAGPISALEQVVRPGA